MYKFEEHMAIKKTDYHCIIHISNSTSTLTSFIIVPIPKPGNKKKQLKGEILALAQEIHELYINIK